MKKYSVYFHYNKPASLKAGKPQLSVHYKNICYIIEGLKCNIPIETRIRKTQPRCVMAGKASDFIIKWNGKNRIGEII